MPTFNIPCPEKVDCPGSDSSSGFDSPVRNISSETPDVPSEPIPVGGFNVPNVPPVLSPIGGGGSGTPVCPAGYYYSIIANACIFGSPPPQPVKFSCVGGVCIEDSFGTYETLVECILGGCGAPPEPPPDPPEDPPAMNPQPDPPPAPSPNQGCTTPDVQAVFPTVQPNAYPLNTGEDCATIVMGTIEQLFWVSALNDYPPGETYCISIVEFNATNIAGIIAYLTIHCGKRYLVESSECDPCNDSYRVTILEPCVQAEQCVELQGQINGMALYDVLCISPELWSECADCIDGYLSGINLVSDIGAWLVIPVTANGSGLFPYILTPDRRCPNGLPGAQSVMIMRFY